MLDTGDRHYCSMCAKLFELATVKGYDSVEFVNRLMNSQIGNDVIFNRENTNIWLGESYVLSVIEEYVNPPHGNTLDGDFMHWVGYIFMYWHIYYRETASDIIRQAPMDVLIKSYNGLHCLSNELAIENLKELSRANA